ncbi:MAG: PqqD family protein [Candidatus Thermoplasmatota archaeon]
MLKKNKNKNKLPTKEQFLNYIPEKADFEWKKNDEGLVELKVQKFKGKLGKSFLKLFRLKNEFSAKMDKIGTVVWLNCDGEKTVGDILEILKEKFPKEDNIEKRLFLFLQQMHQLGYIKF